MRTRVGNHFNEEHGQAMRIYDWIAPVGTDPHAAMLAAETALGVKLHGGTGEAHGYVNTSTRPDGSVYIAVCLYDFEDLTRPVKLRIAPAITQPQRNAMKAAVGEHARHKLGQGNDDTVLEELGFKPGDGARKLQS